MPMGTTDQPQDNPQMNPAPMDADAQRRTARAGQPPATSDYPQQRDPMFDDPQRRDPSHRFDHAANSRAYDERLLDVSQPWLPEDFDKALVMRVYPEAESVAELREMAYEAGREAYALAARAVASVDVPIPGVEDQRDPRTKERLGLKPGVVRDTPPNMPRPGNRANEPEQTSVVDQPPKTREQEIEELEAGSRPEHPHGGPPGQDPGHTPPGQPHPEQHGNNDKNKDKDKTKGGPK